MPWTIFKDALRAWVYTVNGRIRGTVGWQELQRWGRGCRAEGGGRGADLKDARGHEYEKGEGVEDRKFTSRVDARAGEEEGARG